MFDAVTDLKTLPAERLEAELTTLAAHMHAGMYRFLVMVAAVVIAMAIMFLASKPLTDFVRAHPPLIILCLGFLLMIGLSLVADSVGFHIPKGYLYAAIGFSVLIESFNQIALRNRQRWIVKIPRRQRVAEAMLRLLSGVPARTSIRGLVTGLPAALCSPLQIES